MTCNKNNIGSAKSIIRNGGVLENEFVNSDGELEQRYWIDLTESVKPKYYEAYDERYKTAHGKGVSWAGEQSTPIVLKTIRKYRIRPEDALLEIGCGEGRDARAVLDSGYRLLATDISREAIAWCRKTMPEYAEHFKVLDCLSDDPDERFGFIYAVAVVHMLVRDEDRNGFYTFIREHLKPEGLALICTMGDGTFEMQSDIREAFELKEREHESGPMTVAATSCRMVSFAAFERELAENGLNIIEKGITEALPEFDSLMYAVVRRK
ncbi:MAG: methyltransferase domain-containing protein [Lachnospiraceae bacterium]|nr:methyltransferase domain-containing protein [Lachnospiraceae bacterium]